LHGAAGISSDRGQETSALPCYIRLHAYDNVAIVASSGGLPVGTVFGDGLTLREHVQQEHKVTLCDIAKVATIKRYGEVFGYAKRDIAQGSWIGDALT